MSERREQYRYSKEIPSHLPKIGLAGFSRAGKGLAIDILEKELSFGSFTLSNVIREYAASQGIALNQREDYWRVREEIDSELGADYLMRRSLELLGEDFVQSFRSMKGIVLDGLRIPKNVETLKNLDSSFLIGIVADPLTRYNRMSHMKNEESVSFEDFKSYESLEVPDVNFVLSQADVIIENEGTKEEFEGKLLEAVTSKFRL